jgi:hypothetical protein
MKRVVECFPETGSVTAKSFEIHGAGSVSITGTARDKQSVLRTQDLLWQVKEIRDLKIEQMREQTRGNAPVQFNLTFRWVGNTGT